MTERERERETDRQTDRQTDRDRSRQMQLTAISRMRSHISAFTILAI